MNDRFKFRVWDKENNVYLDEGSLLDSRTGEIAGYYDDDVFTIEQCTGLTDKKGKLLFEGDVVSFDGVKMFVEWCEKSCRWVLRYADKKHSLYGEAMSMCPPAEDYYPNEYRIIGNIHETEVER